MCSAFFKRNQSTWTTHTNRHSCTQTQTEGAPVAELWVLCGLNMSPYWTSVLYQKHTALLYSSPTLIAPEWWFDVYCSALWSWTLLCDNLLPGRFLKKWNGPLVSHFHGWLHVRWNFFPLFHPFCFSPDIKMSYGLSRACRRGGVSFFFFFFAFATCLIFKCTNLNPLLLENDSGEKLLLRWIIQTLSFRRVSGLFFPPKKSGQRQWAMWTISASQSATPRKTQPLIVSQCDGRDWGEERRGKSWYFILSEWEEGQSWTEPAAEEKKWLPQYESFLSIFLSLFLPQDGERWGKQIDRQRGMGSPPPWRQSLNLPRLFRAVLLVVVHVCVEGCVEKKWGSYPPP